MEDLSSIFTGENGLVNLILRAYGEEVVLRRAVDAEGARRYEEATVLMAPRATLRSARTSGSSTGCAVLCQRFRAVIAADETARAPRTDRDRLVVAGVEFKIVSVEDFCVCGAPVCYRLECVRG